MVWVVVKLSGEHYRHPDGQPMWYFTKREALAAARAASLTDFNIISVRN